MHTITKEEVGHFFTSTKQENSYSWQVQLTQGLHEKNWINLAVPIYVTLYKTKVSVCQIYTLLKRYTLL
jgi:hypothetical protein